MKMIIPVPNETLTGKAALEAFQRKTKKDRRIFNRSVRRTARTQGFGMSLFATQRNRKKKLIFFDIGWAHKERVDGLDFTIFRYSSPDTPEGKVEMQFLRSQVIAALKGDSPC